jgi:hypothetical protein
MEQHSTLAINCVSGQAIDSVAAEIIRDVQLRLQKIGYLRSAESRPHVDRSISGPRRSKIQGWRPGLPRTFFGGDR